MRKRAWFRASGSVASQSDNSVTQWITQLKQGNHEAAQRLYEKYFRQLVESALKKLGHARRGAADEEDVAHDALKSAILGAQMGRFPGLHNRKDLWQVLVMLTDRKALDHRRREHAQKRGGARVLNQQDLANPRDSSSGGVVEAVARDPTPEEAAMFTENLHHRLGALNDHLRQIALWKLEGYSNQEIAERLAVSVRMVERKLRGIRSIWLDDTGGD